jgi:hypothetical protein
MVLLLLRLNAACDAVVFVLIYVVISCEILREIFPNKLIRVSRKSYMVALRLGHPALQSY